MAIDKAIDSAQLNTDLTSIADAIREKAGLTDSFVFPEGFVQAIAGIEAGGGADITEFGFTKAVFGTTTGSQSFMHNLDETPKCVIFWSDDVIDYATTSTPQYIIRAGIGLVLHAKDGTTEVVESYNQTRYTGGDYAFELLPPTESIPRTGFDVMYNPTTGPGKSGAIMYSKNGTIYFTGEAGSGYKYNLLSEATYHWGVFA